MKNIIFDLDGTLLEKDSSLSKESIDCIHKLSRNNTITIATARSIVGLPTSILKISDCISYYITLNGSSIYDKNNVAIYKNPIKLEDAFNFINALLTLKDLVIEVFADEQWHINSDDARKFFLLGINEKIVDYILSTRIKHKNIAVFISQEAKCVEKITINILNKDNKVSLTNIIDALAEKYNFRISSDNPHKIDIFKKTSNKGNAIKYLVNTSDINTNIISYGNDENDIEMFKVSNISVCMSNASPVVKKNADIILRKNDDKRISRSILLLKRRGVNDLL